MYQKVLISAAVLSLLLSCSARVQAADDDSFVLSAGKAGAVKIGVRVDELYSKVGRQNTMLVDKLTEGYFSPVIELFLGPDTKHPSMEATVGSGFTIANITVFDSAFKTDNGIGVGSTLGDIRRKYKVDWIDFGEGPLFARVEAIGMSFALDYSNPSAEWYQTRNMNLIPDKAKVRSILLMTAPVPATHR